MSKIPKHHFALKSQKDKDKPALIYIMFTLERRYKISIKESVEPRWWNKETERAIVISSGEQNQTTQRHVKRLNKFIDAIDKEASEVFTTHTGWREPNNIPWLPPLTYYMVDRINNFIQNYHKQQKKEQEKKTIIPSLYFEEYNLKKLPKKINKRTGTFMKPETQVNYWVVLKRYKEYLADNRRIDSFIIFDEKFENDFTAWCYENKGYTPNTIASTFSILKVWLIEAEKEKLITNQAYRHYRTKADSPVHYYLTENEITRIKNLSFTDEFLVENHIDRLSRIEETRDLFIIACRTGLRYSDWKNLTDSEWDFEKNVVSINTQKTTERVVIPIHSDIKPLYEKYKGIFPKPVDKSHANLQIAKICKIAGIDDDVYVNEVVYGKNVQKHYKKYETITTHTARRSFATNLYLKCKNAGMVMQFTGHKTEENFFKYICVSKQEVADLAQEFFK